MVLPNKFAALNTPEQAKNLKAELLSIKEELMFVLAAIN